MTRKTKTKSAARPPFTYRPRHADRRCAWQARRAQGGDAAGVVGGGAGGVDGAAAKGIILHLDSLDPPLARRLRCLRSFYGGRVRAVGKFSADPI